MKPHVYIINCPPGWTKTPPMALAYLTNYLHHNEVDTQAIDLNIELFKYLGQPKESWLGLDAAFENNLFHQVSSSHPEFIASTIARLADATIIGFSLFKRNASFTFQLAEKIKKTYPNKQIVIGGPHVMQLEKENRLSNDYTWVIGEGESALLEIARGSDKKLFKFEETPNLDSLPQLDFDMFNLKNYSSVLPLLSSRGCKFNCAFCSERLLYKKFRMQSPECTARQIKELKEKYKCSTFVFCDSMINSDNAWLESFCRILIKQKLNIKWEAQFRIAAAFTQQTAELMRESGCYNLFIGLESGTDNTLKVMRKGYIGSTAKECLAVLRDAGLHYEISLIFGYPGESEEDFQATIDFIVNNKTIIPKIAQANPFVDYLNDFPGQTFSSPDGLARVERFLKIFLRI